MKIQTGSVDSCKISNRQSRIINVSNSFIIYYSELTIAT